MSDNHTSSSNSTTSIEVVSEYFDRIQAVPPSYTLILAQIFFVFGLNLIISYIHKRFIKKVQFDVSAVISSVNPVFSWLQVILQTTNCIYVHLDVIFFSPDLDSVDKFLAISARISNSGYPTLFSFILFICYASRGQLLVYQSAILCLFAVPCIAMCILGNVLYFPIPFMCYVFAILADTDDPTKDSDMFQWFRPNLGRLPTELPLAQHPEVALESINTSQPSDPNVATISEDNTRHTISSSTTDQININAAHNDTNTDNTNRPVTRCLNCIMAPIRKHSWAKFVILRLFVTFCGVVLFGTLCNYSIMCVKFVFHRKLGYFDVIGTDFDMRNTMRYTLAKTDRIFSLFSWL